MSSVDRRLENARQASKQATNMAQSSLSPKIRSTASPPPSMSTPATITSPSTMTNRLQKTLSPTKVRNEGFRSEEPVPPVSTAAELTREQLKENVSQQLNEIEMLEMSKPGSAFLRMITYALNSAHTDIYCQPGELELSDPLIKEEMNDFVYGRLKVPPIAPQITMHIKCNSGDEEDRYGSNENMNNENSSNSPTTTTSAVVLQLLLEISIELPIAYPICASPSIHVRLPSGLAPRRQLRFLQRRLNSEVERWVQTWHRLNHETCLLQVLSWLDQNAFSYISTTSSSFSRRLAFETDDDVASSGSNSSNNNHNDADEGNEGDLDDVADDDDDDEQPDAVSKVVAGDNAKLVDAETLKSSRSSKHHSKTRLARDGARRDSDEASSTAVKSPTKKTPTGSVTSVSDAGNIAASASTSIATIQPRAGQHLQPIAARRTAAAATGSASTRRRMRVEDSGCSNGDSSSVNQCGPHEDDGVGADDDDENEVDDDDEDAIAADDEEEEEEDEAVLAMLNACDMDKTAQVAEVAPTKIPRSNSLIGTTSGGGRTAKKLTKNLSSAQESSSSSHTAPKSSSSVAQQQQPPSPPPAAIPRSPSLGSRAGLAVSSRAAAGVASTSSRSNINSGIERRLAFNLNFGATRKQQQQPQEKSANEQVVFERLWIHSHHIKAKSKREFLLAKAKQLDLSGFTRAGKPGIICVEGRREDCREFWEQCRRLNWQKISLRYEEQHVLTLARLETSSIDDYRRFRGFREVSFSSRTGGIADAAENNASNDADNDDADDGGRSTASSSRMAAFIAWLVEHQSTEAIPYILGFTPSDQHLTMLLASVRNAKKAAAAADPLKSPKRHNRRKSSSRDADAGAAKKDATRVKDDEKKQKKVSSAASTTSSSSSASDPKQSGSAAANSKKPTCDVDSSPKKVMVPFVRSSSAMENATLNAPSFDGGNDGSSSKSCVSSSSSRVSLLRPFSDDNTEH